MDDRLRDLERRHRADPMDIDAARALYRARDRAGIYPGERLRKHLQRLEFDREDREADDRADAESKELGHDPEEAERHRDYHRGLLFSPRDATDPKRIKAKVERDKAWQWSRKARGTKPDDKGYRERAAQEREERREPVGGKRSRRYESIGVNMSLFDRVFLSEDDAREKWKRDYREKRLERQPFWKATVSREASATESDPETRKRRKAARSFFDWDRERKKTKP